MKILLHDYGGYHFTYQLGGAFADIGYIVQYVYSETTQQVQRFKENSARNLILTGITLKQPYAKYNYIKRRQSEVSYGRKVAKKVSDFKPDVVISANTPLDAQRLIQKASQQVGAKFIFWMQDVVSSATTRTLEGEFSLLGKAIGKHYQRMERALLRRSNGVVLISENFVHLMREWNIPDENIHVIPNWAPIDQITPQPHDNPWSAKMGLVNTFNFLYTGILGLKHDPSIFLDLGDHFRNNANVRVVIISKGDHFEWLQGEAHNRGLNNLVLLEFQPSQVYPLVLGAGDVLVSVLKSQAGVYSVPSKVMSYLCAQRPILLSVPLNNLAVEMVLEAGAGMVSPPDDRMGFLQQARILYENEDLRYNFGTSGRDYAEVKFNIVDITHRFEAIIA